MTNAMLGYQVHDPLSRTARNIVEICIAGFPNECPHRPRVGGNWQHRHQAYGLVRSDENQLVMSVHEERDCVDIAYGSRFDSATCTSPEFDGAAVVEPDVEVTGESRDGLQAIADIRRLAPDLVFLDVEMPERNGLQVVSEIGLAAMPPTIFVTAYDRYAAAAFDAELTAVAVARWRYDGFGVALSGAPVQ
jgi:CheY-like chemotaxis protein